MKIAEVFHSNRDCNYFSKIKEKEAEMKIPNQKLQKISLKPLSKLSHNN